jgi:hypothetical protein
MNEQVMELWRALLDMNAVQAKLVCERYRLGKKAQITLNALEEDGSFVVAPNYSARYGVSTNFSVISSGEAIPSSASPPRKK